MKGILILIAISSLLSSTASAFQGGGGESTKTPKPTPKPKSAPKPKVEPRKRSSTPATPLPRPRAGQAGIELVLIPAGEFTMGSNNGSEDEKPVHRVAISQPFYMGKYEVTQGQWQSVMGNNPSYFKNCDDCPVEKVSWNDVQQFLAKLNERSDGFHYRLPTEAEWEYACRAGTTGDYAGDLDSMAWYGNNSGNSRLDANAIARDDPSNYYKRLTDNGNKTHQVGTKQANAWGLYDMHGNVWERCQDWYDESYYRNGASSDPQGSSSGQFRVLRGGSWLDGSYRVRSAYRYRDQIGDHEIIGFRVVAVARTQ